MLAGGEVLFLQAATITANKMNGKA
jgi:hypothetical protein